MKTALVIFIILSFQIVSAQKASEKKYGYLTITNKKTDQVKRIGQGTKVKCWNSDNHVSRGRLLLLSDSTLMVDGDFFYIDSIHQIRDIKRKVNAFGVFGIGTGIWLMSAGALVTIIEIVYSVLASDYTPIIGPVIFFSGGTLFTAGILRLTIKKRFHSSKSEFDIVIRSL